MKEKYDSWKFDWEPAFLDMTRDFIFRNTFADIEFAIKTLGQEHGTKFEFECYDLGHLYNLAGFWIRDGSKGQSLFRWFSASLAVLALIWII